MNQIDPETTNKISLIQKETFVRTGKIHDKIDMVTRNIHINQLKRKHNKKLFELSKKKYNSLLLSLSMNFSYLLWLE